MSGLTNNVDVTITSQWPHKHEKCKICKPRYTSLILAAEETDLHEILKMSCGFFQCKRLSNHFQHLATNGKSQCNFILVQDNLLEEPRINWFDCTLL